MMQSIGALHYAGAQSCGLFSNQFERRMFLAGHLRSRFKRVRRFVRTLLAMFIDLLQLHSRMPIPLLVFITSRRSSGCSSRRAIDVTESGLNLSAGSGTPRAADAASAEGNT